MQENQRADDREKERPDTPHAGDASEEQTERPYYYDDAHSYEAFNPSDPEERSDDEDQAAS
jgi:hypothetical protein